MLGSLWASSPATAPVFRLPPYAACRWGCWSAAAACLPEHALGEVKGAAAVHDGHAGSTLLTLKSAKSLLAAVQAHALELRVGVGPAAQPRKMDRVVFTLAPGRLSLPFARVMAAATAVHDGLAALHLASFPLLLGPHTLQIVVPVHLAAVATVTATAQAFVHKMAALHPGLLADTAAAGHDAGDDTVHLAFVAPA